MGRCCLQCQNRQINISAVYIRALKCFSLGFQFSGPHASSLFQTTHFLQCVRFLCMYSKWPAKAKIPKIPPEGVYIQHIPQTRHFSSNNSYIILLNDAKTHCPWVFLSMEEYFSRHEVKDATADILYEGENILDEVLL